MESTRLVKLGSLAAIVRSKNAGPYRITFDVLFDREDLYADVLASRSLNPKSIASAYGGSTVVSSFFEIPIVRAFKATIIRPRAQCGIGEGDVFGAQQHVPLMNMLVPISSSLTVRDDKWDH
ncbi:DUF4387 domain-containing protein [Nocardia sp. NPDC059239]|uniref:DUF4387 domain-containing protein n=1 Tax=Nocardia sp. NPDC059239 TaxID=3346785 RepID=UPI0036CB3F8C